MSIIAFKLSDEILDLLLFTVSPADDHVLSTSAADAGTENIAHANFERRGQGAYIILKKEDIPGLRSLS